MPIPEDIPMPVEAENEWVDIINTMGELDTTIRTIPDELEEPKWDNEADIQRVQHATQSVQQSLSVHMMIHHTPPVSSTQHTAPVAAIQPTIMKPNEPDKHDMPGEFPKYPKSAGLGRLGQLTHYSHADKGYQVDSPLFLLTITFIILFARL
ncbi:hypothetical protein BDB01DRAFT_852332 [Pilobolus umbonatus]|nr:hypothetical protein BDB01DRAFT_852332 [Pilobolus umbonatus]